MRIEDLRVHGEGWRLGKIEFANLSLPRKPLTGLIDGDGTCWEAYPFEIPTKPKDRKFIEQHLDHKAFSYDLRLVEVEGILYLAERMNRGKQFVPWAGLELTGSWVDHSCNGNPDQLHASGVIAGEKVVLYLRWRYGDPWDGHVVQHDLEQQGHLFFRSPWSQNLLPTEPPDPNAPKTLLGMLRSGVPRESWVEHDNLRRAKELLLKKADAWLRGDHEWDLPI